MGTRAPTPDEPDPRRQRPRGWHRRLPQRWAAERRALDAAGWRYRVRYRDRNVDVRIEYPIPTALAGSGGAAGVRPDAPDAERQIARLHVRFPQTYPHFAAEVYDRHNDLNLVRHRNPVHDGLLCLGHDEDHQPSLLLAEVIAQQLPRLLATGRSISVAPAAASQPQEDGGPLEHRAPEPLWVDMTRQARDFTMLVPDHPVPLGVDAGALVVRFRHDGSRASLRLGVIEHVLGPDLNIAWPHADHLAGFRLLVHGRWLRDPQYRPDDSAEAIWQRLQPRLQPLAVEAPSNGQGVPPEQLEVIGLLVPGVERNYREAGDGWVFLVRACAPAQSGSDDATHTEKATLWLAEAQYFSAHATTARNPLGHALADKHVVLVGCGAIGHHIAIDLCRAGLGRLTLIDRDRIDVNTASRQPAPFFASGESKSGFLSGELMMNNPDCDVRAVLADVRSVWDEHAGDTASAMRSLRREMREADLVIDATATPATAFLAAVRWNRGKSFLTVAGTAGLWGGWVADIDPALQAGCYECLQHHRSEGTVPIPPADPTGWTTPVHCSSPTFTGTNADAASIAHMASRVAVDRLSGGKALRGRYFVGSLRSAGGALRPLTWEAAMLERHMQCPCHR